MAMAVLPGLIYPTKNSSAQSQSQAAIIEATNETIHKSVIPLLKAGLTQEAQRTLEGVEISVVDSISVNAGAPPVSGAEIGKIRMTSELSALLSTVCRTTSVAFATGHVDLLPGVINRMGLIISAAETDKKVQFPNDNISRFIGLNPDSIPPDIVEKSLGMHWTCYVESLSFIVAHELSHVINHDPEKGRRSLTALRGEETRADQFAATTLERAHKSVFSFSLMLGMLAVAEYDINNDASDETIRQNLRNQDHPFSLCRARSIFDAGVRELDADPVFQRSLKGEPGSKDRWRQYQVDTRASLSNMSMPYCSASEIDRIHISKSGN